MSRWWQRLGTLVALLLGTPGCVTSLAHREIVNEHAHRTLAATVTGVEVTASPSDAATTVLGARIRVTYDDGDSAAIAVASHRVAPLAGDAARRRPIFVIDLPGENRSERRRFAVGAKARAVGAYGEIEPSGRRLTADDLRVGTIVTVRMSNASSGWVDVDVAPPGGRAVSGPPGREGAVLGDPMSARIATRTGEYVSGVAAFTLLLPLTVAVDLATAPLQFLVDVICGIAIARSGGFC